MEIFVLSLVAIGALIWAAKGSSAIGRLEEKHQQLRKELARAASRVETLASELKTLRDTVSNLKTAPPAKKVEALRAAVRGRETMRCEGKELYVVYPDGIGRSKLTGTLIESKLGTRGTARNWNTVLKLAAQLGA